MSLKFTQEDVGVRLRVKASFSISCGLYDKPIDAKNVAALVEEMIAAAGGIESFINTVEIASLHLDDGTELIPAAA